MAERGGPTSFIESVFTRVNVERDRMLLREKKSDLLILWAIFFSSYRGGGVRFCLESNF